MTGRLGRKTPPDSPGADPGGSSPVRLRPMVRADLVDVLARLRGTDAQNLLEAVFFDVDRYVGQARQHDDITCLVLRRD